MNEIKIPKARVAILIGKKGEMKKKIEKLAKVKLDVSKEGEVVISGEGLNCYLTMDVVKAIGRGFNPKIALKLLKEDFTLQVLDIKDYTGKSEKKFVRIKGRLIGKEGTTWKLIEEKTNTDVSVYGKTIAIIGKFTDVDVARRAFEKLLKGSPHSKVYTFIEFELKKRIGGKYS